jgi:murein L,D-transpeptidase YcbB/YkuD
MLLRIALVGVVTLCSSPTLATEPQPSSPDGGAAPQMPICSQLEDALGKYRGIESSGGWPTLQSGRAPKPGASDPRMTTLRRRLEVTGDLTDADGAGSASDVYDPSLEAGVRRFQARHGLSIDGVLGPATVAAMNVPAHARVEQLQTALERCRSDLRDVSGRFVVVNIASFRVLFVEDGNVTWSSRVIVGAPYTKTPMFHANMQYIELNPTWTVPKSIEAKEIIPAIHRDGHYLQRMHMKRVGDDIVQMPGPQNALGRIKLMLPNQYDVYLHDTPTKNLFRKANRAFSHGCIRVEKPVELAALALNDPQWTPQAIEAAIDTGESRKISLRTPVPVVITSWPATADREGVIEFLPELYKDDEGDKAQTAAR